MREKVGKSRNTVFFQWFGAPEGRKVGSLKRRVRSQLARWEMKKLHAVCGAKHISKSKCTKHTILGPLLEVTMSKKVHAVVARSTFPSQNVQSTSALDHFWKLRCRKSARRCGAKHISKSKCTKHTMYGPFLEVQMSKKCTLLWREAHFEVKMYKTHHVRTTFGGSDVVFAWQAQGHCGPCQKWAKREGLVAFSTATTSTPHYTPIHYTALQLQLQLHLHYILLHYTPLHYTALNYTQLHYTTLHYTTLHSTTLQLQLRSTSLHYTPLHSTTLNYTTLHYITLRYITFHYTSLHCTALHSTTLQLQLQLHYTPLHSTTLNYTTLHYITLHYTTFHYTSLHYTTLPYTEWHCTTDRQVDR